MKVKGNKIKATRKRIRLTQKEVAQGICSQSTISNIESRGACDSINIFSQVCTRLLLSVGECVEENTKLMEGTFNEVVILCEKKMYIEAYELLSNQGYNPEFNENLTKTKHLYYIGLAYLYGKNSPEEALCYFRMVCKSNKDDTIYTGLCLKVIRQLRDEYLGSLNPSLYYEKVIEVVKELGLAFPLEQCEIYYSCAKFFASTGNYGSCLDSCKSGLRINRLSGRTYYLVELLYERTNALERMGKSHIEDYREMYCISRYLRKKD